MASYLSFLSKQDLLYRINRQKFLKSSTFIKMEKNQKTSHENIQLLLNLSQKKLTERKIKHKLS